MEDAPAPGGKPPRTVTVRWRPSAHRFVLSALEVRVVGTQAAERPWPYREVRLHYVVTGQGLEPALVHRAVSLSHERYCSAIATIRGAAKVGYSIEIREP